jgi:hypothetical protein
VPHVNFVAAFALEFLLSSDHNVVGLTLELLNAALLHYGALRATWRACVARCTALLCGQIFGFAVAAERPRRADAGVAAAVARQSAHWRRAACVDAL